MAEIYSYDISTHERFARDQKEIEAFRRQYHVPPSGARIIAMQARVLDFIPKLRALETLLGTYQGSTWARFGVPKNFHNQRYLTSYVAPSLGPKEKHDADIHKIEALIKQKEKGVSRKKEKDEDQQQQHKDQQHESNEDEIFIGEGQDIILLLEKGVKETNEMVDFVIARMHQFMQA